MSNKVWEQVKNTHPHLKLWEVGKIIGQMWRDLPEQEKAIFVEEYDIEKAQYNETLRQYHNSPAYQAWLSNKERAGKMIEEQELDKKQAALRARERPSDIPPSDLRESYMLEDNEEETDEQYTVKHVAAARFQRNHRLMQEILSDTRLPDPGQLITQSRLNTLRLQVEQLKNHKRNLCQEIETCESRHRSKVQRISADSTKFVTDYEALTSARPMITDPQFCEMIVKAKHDIQREEEERRMRYMAEIEARRRRQQQRQREAELAAAEAERRRQQPQVPPKMHQLSADKPVQQSPSERADESRAEQQPKETSQQQASRPASNQSSHPAKPSTTSTEEDQSVGAAVLPPGMAPKYLHQTGHTQHHYPPPPNYPPDSATPNIQRPSQVGHPTGAPGSLISKPQAPVQTPLPPSAGAPALSSKKKKPDPNDRKSDSGGVASPGGDRRIGDSSELAPTGEHVHNVPMSQISRAQCHTADPSSPSISAPQGPHPAAYGPDHAAYHTNVQHPSYPPHVRPAFGQHGYHSNIMQQYPQEHSSSAPPPMYMQQHIPTDQSHQPSTVGWHQGAPPGGYPQYGPPPRYGGPAGPMSAYNTQHPSRQIVSPGGGPNAVPGGPGPQQIPAPPPYHHQQNIPGGSGYWSGSHHQAPEYPPGQPQHQPGHHYMSADVHPAQSMGPVPPASVMPPGSAPTHMEAAAVPPQQIPAHHPAQHTNVYYASYPHPSMQGGYGAPGGSAPQGGGNFYPLPPQATGHYPPPPPSYHAQGSWAPGYAPPAMMGSPHHGYQSPHQAAGAKTSQPTPPTPQMDASTPMGRPASANSSGQNQ